MGILARNFRLQVEQVIVGHSDDDTLILVLRFLRFFQLHRFSFSSPGTAPLLLRKRFCQSRTALFLYSIDVQKTFYEVLGCICCVTSCHPGSAFSAGRARLSCVSGPVRKTLCCFSQEAAQMF